MRPRKPYKPSGKVNLQKFLVGFPLFGLVTFFGAFLLQRIYLFGYYYIFIVPVLMAFPFTLLYGRLIRLTHCRNPLLGILFGIVFSSVFYIGFFYIDMVYSLQEKGIYRVDLVPKWIEMRMNTNTTTDHPSEKKVDSGPNWLAFGFEFAIILFLFASTGWGYGRLPYDEETKEWYKMAILTYPPGWGNNILPLIDEGNWEKIKSLPLREVGLQATNFTSVVIFYLSAQHPSYLAIKKIRYSNGIFQAKLYTLSLGTSVLRPSTLSQREFEFFKKEFIDRGVGYGDVGHGSVRMVEE